jgi:hypothetical protein
VFVLVPHRYVLVHEASTTDRHSLVMVRKAFAMSRRRDEPVHCVYATVNDRDASVHSRLDPAALRPVFVATGFEMSRGVHVIALHSFVTCHS